MAWTPGERGGAATPTVFEQQREELVREIAGVSFAGKSVEFRRWAHGILV